MTGLGKFAHCFAATNASKNQKFGSNKSGAVLASSAAGSRERNNARQD